MTADAFVHLPHLRGRVKPAEASSLRVTPQVLAMWDERARQLGRPPNWRLTDQQLDDSRRALIGSLDKQGRDDAGLWVFSYGSLMWDPGFHFAEVRQAALDGYQRRFSFKTYLGRGSLEQPALMLSIEPRAGCCQGLAFRIAADVAEAESTLLWRREMLRGAYRPLLLPVRTPQGDVTALVFTSNPAHADHVGELPLETAAAMIAAASGILGSNTAYLEQLIDQLASLGLEDAYTLELLGCVRRVAASV